MNYLAGIIMVTTGVVLGLFVRDVNTVLQWIVSGLYGGYVAANMLKWHWWRFNASGFFWGMLAGIIPAIALAILKSFGWLHGLDLYYWPVLFLLSLAGSILGSYAAPPTEEKVLCTTGPALFGAVGTVTGQINYEIANNGNQLDLYLPTLKLRRTYTFQP